MVRERSSGLHLHQRNVHTITCLSIRHDILSDRCSHFLKQGEKQSCHFLLIDTKNGSQNGDVCYLVLETLGSDLDFLSFIPSAVGQGPLLCF